MCLEGLYSYQHLYQHDLSRAFKSEIERLRELLFTSFREIEDIVKIKRPRFKVSRRPGCS